MRTRKHGLKALGAALMAALSLLALGSAGAQAAPHFNVNGATLNAAKSISGSTTEVGLPWVLSANNATISCKNVAAVSATIEGEGKSKGTLNFSACTVTSAPVCSVAEPITATIKDQLIKHGTGVYDLFEPASGTQFTAIQFLGEECGLAGEPLPVTGRTVGVADNEEEKETHTVTFDETVEKLFVGQTEGGVTLPKAELKLGANLAKFMGRGTLILGSKELWSPKKE